jgi:hypothetical protein
VAAIRQARSTPAHRAGRAAATNRIPLVASGVGFRQVIAHLDSPITEKHFSGQSLTDCKNESS